MKISYMFLFKGMYRHIFLFKYITNIWIIKKQRNIETLLIEKNIYERSQDNRSEWKPREGKKDARKGNRKRVAHLEESQLVTLRSEKWSLWFWNMLQLRLLCSRGRLTLHKHSEGKQLGVRLCRCGLWLSAGSVVLKKKTVKGGEPVQSVSLL